MIVKHCAHITNNQFIHVQVTVYHSKDFVDGFGHWHIIYTRTSVSCVSSSCLGNGVQLIKEQHTGGSRPGLVKDVPHVGLWFSEPHGQQLRALDGDEVGLTFISDGLGQQSFTTTWWSVEQHSFWWSHSELQELLWMFHWVLKNNIPSVT